MHKMNEDTRQEDRTIEKKKQTNKKKKHRTKYPISKTKGNCYPEFFISHFIRGRKITFHLALTRKFRQN